MTEIPDIDQLALMAGLSISEDYKQGVALNLGRILVQAGLVMRAPLPHSCEPAPIFVP
jgi:hypothetical protein